MFVKFYFCILFSLFLTLNVKGQSNKLTFGKFQLDAKLKQHKDCKPPKIKILNSKKVLCSNEHVYYNFKGTTVQKSYLTFSRYGDLERIEYIMRIIGNNTQEVVDNVMAFVSVIEKDYKSFGEARKQNPMFLTQYYIDNETISLKIAYAYSDSKNNEFSVKREKGYHPVLIFVASKD